jgi:hypothetical protein
MTAEHTRLLASIPHFFRRRPTLTTAYMVGVVGAAVVANRRFVGGNTDHLYYQVMAMRFAGQNRDQAFETVAGANPDYELPITGLDYGLLSTDIGPLIYPRYLLPKLMSLLHPIVGSNALTWTTLGLGIATLVLLVALTGRTLGAFAALAVLPIALATRLYSEYTFGVYTESLMLFLTVAVVLALPIHVPRSRWNWATVGALFVLMALVRQLPTLPVGLVGGGWLFEVWRTRRVRNAWLPYAVIATAVAGTGYVLISRWAPYDPIPYLRRFYGIEGSLWRWEPGHLRDVGRSLLTDWRRTDPLAPVVLAFAFVGAYSLRRTAMPWIWLGTVLAALSSLVLNRPEYRFWSPAVLLGVVLAAQGVACVFEGVASRSRGERYSSNGAVAAPIDINEERALDEQSTRRAAFACAGSVLLVAATGIALIRDHRSGEVRSIERVGEIVPDLESVAPDLDPNSVVTCAGNDGEVWIAEPEGTRYAVTVTAQKRHFGMVTSFYGLNWQHVAVDDVYVPAGLEGFVTRCRAYDN